MEKWLTPDEWLERLDSDSRAKADGLIQTLTELGASEPVLWVRSEITEDIPQFARFLVLRQIREVMDAIPYGSLKIVEDAAAEVGSTHDMEEIDNEGNAAFDRLLESGADLGDIFRVLRAVKVNAIFAVANILDEGNEPSLDEAPGWALVETDSEGNLTNRSIGGLHESLMDVLETDTP